MEVEQILKQIV
jgi:hypothetical protein